GPLQIGVTTNGRGCKLAGRIRREVAAGLAAGAGVAGAGVRGEWARVDGGVECGGEEEAGAGGGGRRRRWQGGGGGRGVWGGGRGRAKRGAESVRHGGRRGQDEEDEVAVAGV